MLERQEVLLLTSVVHFVVVKAVITKMLAPYVRIINNSDVCSTIDQTSMYELSESILGAKWHCGPSVHG